MRTLIHWSSLALTAGASAIQLVRPARTNPPTDPSRTLTATADVPEDAAGVLVRACRDCHSNDTRWPWYSRVAPISWLVVDHVNHGRRHFNYSDWAKHDAGERERLLKNVCTSARKGGDAAAHPHMDRDARLTDEEVLALCGWAERQRASTAF